MANKCIPYDLREAEPGDAKALAEVQVASWHAAYKDLVPKPFLDHYTVAMRTQRWDQILDGGSEATTTLAEFNNLTDAFVSYGPCRDEDRPGVDAGEIWSLYAHPSSWGNGVGQTLCTYALDRLHSSGAMTASLWVFKGNDRAIRFYEKLGFVPDGEARVEPFGEADLTELRFTLSL